MNTSFNRSLGYKPGFFCFCVFALVWSTFLLFAGGVTTSIDAGMAFLDWPLSNGSINPEGWIGDTDMRAEHSHRLLGMVIGIISIIMVVWTHLKEERNWVRRMAVFLLLVVILQGIIGGARVRFDQLNTGADHNLIAQTFAVFHATGAQIVLCLLVAITVASSRLWIERNGRLSAPIGRTTRIWGIAVCASIVLQIITGAVIRHANIGLAIGTFPHASADGSLLPPVWNWAIALNFSHRVGAVVILLLLGIFLGKIWGTPHARRALGGLSFVPIVLVVIQTALGALVIIKQLNNHATVAHHLIGAFLLASCWMLTFLSFRLPLNDGRNQAEQLS